MASVIKEVLKEKEFEHLCFDGIIRFPQKGEIELLLSCDMRLAIGKMKSTEEIKKEVKEIEQMKEAFGRGDGKAS
ncbi:MAG: hypothetical protein NZ942_04160, partial [Candidatus Aenigmarchaeota archaeon]|nr:hypothetical protein [Candidatus Aenigmarchaeota archaeon]